MKRLAIIFAIQFVFLVSSFGQFEMLTGNDYRERFTGRFEGLVQIHYRMLMENYYETDSVVITVEKFTGYTNGVNSNYLNMDHKVGVTFDTTAYANTFVWCSTTGDYFTVRGYLFPTIDTSGHLTYPELVQCESGGLEGFISTDSIRVSYGNTSLMEEYNYKLVGVRKASSIPETTIHSHLISVFPSPARDLIHIEEADLGSTFSILDLTGRTVSRGKLDHNTLNISSLNPGLYILRIPSPRGMFSGKFIKE